MKKVKAALAAEVCDHFDLDRKARPLLKPDATPAEFLGALKADRQHQSAVCFLAHALPAREAVWWASLCVGQKGGAALPPAELAATRASVTWVLDPSEQNRQAAEKAAAAVEKGTPAELLAVAVAWTGGSLSPPVPKVPPVPPGPYLPAKGVYGAVLLAATKAGGADVQETLRAFVELGLGVAEGRYAWPDVRPKAVGATWGF
jgi:hypothetical protein